MYFSFGMNSVMIVDTSRLSASSFKNVNLDAVFRIYTCKGFWEHVGSCKLNTRARLAQTVTCCAGVPLLVFSSPGLTPREVVVRSSSHLDEREGSSYRREVSGQWNPEKVGVVEACYPG